MTTKNHNRMILNTVKRPTNLILCFVFSLLLCNASLAQIYIQPSLGPSLTYADYGKIELTSNTGVLIADSRLSQISLGFNLGLELAYQLNGFAFGIKATYINTGAKTAKAGDETLPINDKIISTFGVGPMASLQIGEFDLSLSAGISSINIDNTQNGYYINHNIAYRLGKLNLGVDYQFSRFKTVFDRASYHTASLMVGYTIANKK